MTDEEFNEAWTKASDQTKLILGPIPTYDNYIKTINREFLRIVFVKPSHCIRCEDHPSDTWIDHVKGCPKYVPKEKETPK